MKFCRRPFDFVHILPNGDVRSCGWTDGVIGNILKSDLKDIWNGEKAERMRESIRNGSFSYCRKQSCFELENDSLPDIGEEEFLARSVVPELPEEYSVACDYICNHSCPSCREHVFVPDEQYRKNVATMVEKLLPYLNKAKKVGTDGSGDAFASPYIMHMLENLHPEDPECRVGIETNGALFDEAHWKRISHLGDYYFSVTVTPNSFEPATFKYLNGGHDDYEQLVHNLYFIRDLKRQGIVNRYNISIVVQDRNFMELPSFCERCIRDFEVDRVVVKPLYKWFGLSDDLYWFKDILNPCHPYHKEYLEMLKDPRLKDEKVFFWGGHNLHPAQPHPGYRYREYLNIYTKLTESAEAVRKVKAYFAAEGIEDLYIYGDNEISAIMYNALKDTVTIKGFVARDKCRDEICGAPVTCLCDYQPDPKDTMLILNYHYFVTIRRDFDVMGFTGRLLALDKLTEAVFG